MRCVSCALEQMGVLEAFNRRQSELGQPALAVGVGIHTGPLVAGYIGSSKALSYTVIGDTANTSARLCGVALGGQILVSEQTLAQLGQRFEVQELPPAQLKGFIQSFKNMENLSNKGFVNLFKPHNKIIYHEGPGRGNCFCSFIHCQHFPFHFSNSLEQGNF